MSKENVAVIRGAYDAFGRGDLDAVLAAFSPAIVWNEAENFPYADGNPYHGIQAVVEGVFARIPADWDGFTIVVDELLDAGDTVVETGRYLATSKATGRPIRAQQAHVWRFRDGKVVGFQQYCDTLQVARAVGQV